MESLASSRADILNQSPQLFFNGILRLREGKNRLSSWRRDMTLVRTSHSLPSMQHGVLSNAAHWRLNLSRAIEVGETAVTSSAADWSSQLGGGPHQMIQRLISNGRAGYVTCTITTNDTDAGEEEFTFWFDESWPISTLSRKIQHLSHLHSSLLPQLRDTRLEPVLPCLSVLWLEFLT